jgi:ribosome biogenesis protein MAK21
MKKNKTKPVGNDLSSGIEIASSALENLANRLKVDLSRQAGDTNGKRTLEKKAKNDKKNVKRVQSESKKVATGKVTEKENVEKPPPAKKQKRGAKETKETKSASLESTPHVEKSKSHDSKKLKKDKRATRKHRKEKDNVSSADPLLKEILALGGSKDDLELIKDIDSEDEIVANLNESKKNFSNEKTVLHLKTSLMSSYNKS